MKQTWGIEMRVVRFVNGQIAEEMATALYQRFPTEALVMDAYKHARTLLSNITLLMERPTNYHDNKLKAAGDR